jgi:hypothetical protein
MLRSSTILVVGTVQSLVVDLMARVPVLPLVCWLEIMVVPGYLVQYALDLLHGCWLVSV